MDTTFLHFLHSTATALNLQCTDTALTHCVLYATELLRWNTHTNLVGKTTLASLITELIIDSFQIAHVLQNLSLINPVTFDLGAGAGIPGIPLRCIWTEGSYTMVEVREKRALFLTYILHKCMVQRTFVLQEDARKVCTKHKDNIDIILSRAFMPPEKLCLFCNTLYTTAVQKNRYLLLMLNTPLPAIPTPYTLAKQHTYIVHGKERILTLLLHNIHNT